MIKLSLLMLVYNEIEYITAFQDVFFNSFDELVFVDMGSTDGSLDAIAALPVERTKLVTMERRDLFLQGFAHARNLGAEQASGDWIFAIDADELVMPAEIDSLREHLAQCGHDVCGVGRRNYHAVAGFGPEDWQAVIADAAFDSERHLRVYRRDTAAHWKGVIHEEIYLGDEPAYFNHDKVDLDLHHLSAFRKQQRMGEKGGLYAWMTLHAFANRALRSGTNEWWFSTYVPQHYVALCQLAREFADAHGLPAHQQDDIERVIAEDKAG